MASKRKFRRLSCEGKIRYETYAKADWAKKPDLHSYHCKFCGGYHNGHPMKGKQRVRN